MRTPSRERLTSGVLLAAGALSGCGATAGAAAPQGRLAPAQPSARQPPPVVVTLVVDQLGAWIIDERLALLPGDGGFARLRREGTWARDVRFAHAVTDTAPGHAALYTGAAPRGSGIFANDVVDPATRAVVGVVRDPGVRLVGPAGPTTSAAASLARLRVETLADRLRAERPEAWIVGVSIKDRGAVFGAGRRPDAALWFDPGLDSFVTSTAFASALPAWALPVGSPEALRRAREAPWRPLDEPWLRAHATQDAQPGEGDLGGFGTTFPHDFSASRAPAEALRASPLADEAVLALALAALDERPEGRGPTLLAISLSAHDYIAHVFGPQSWEAWDELRRLDAALGRFFGALDARLGPERWAALLTADHGSTPLPETSSDPSARPWCAPGVRDRWERPCAPGGRLWPPGLAAELSAAAVEALGAGDWVLGFAHPYAVLTPAARALDEGRRAALLRALTERLTAHPEVERVIEPRTLPAACPPPAEQDTLEGLVCRSYLDGAGDLYVVLRSGSVFDTGYVPGAGTNHGSHHLHDRAVPLFVRAPGWVPAARTIDAPLQTGAFTRTAAALLGIAPPSSAAAAPDLTVTALPSW